MSCQSHPNKESVSTCQFCGKELCEECAINIAGKNYCENCMSELIGPELTSIAKNKSLNKDNVTSQKNHGKEEQVKGVQTPIKEDIVQETSKMNNIQQNIMGQVNIGQDNVKQYDTDAKIDEIATIPPQKDLNNDYDDLYSDDRLYNDINEGTIPRPSNKNVEEKYEKYLDDLYFDEKSSSGENDMTNPSEGLSLTEQLAMDEAKHGSITKEVYVPEIEEEAEISSKTPKKFEDNDENRNRSVAIMENLRNEDSIKNKKRVEEEKDEYSPSSLHGQRIIHYKKKEESSSSTERVLTMILIVLIILVTIYLIYLFTLQSQYPNFSDVLTAFFSDPGKVLREMST